MWLLAFCCGLYGTLYPQKRSLLDCECRLHKQHSQLTSKSKHISGLVILQYCTPCYTTLFKRRCKSEAATTAAYVNDIKLASPVSSPTRKTPFVAATHIEKGRVGSRYWYTFHWHNEMVYSPAGHFKITSGKNVFMHARFSAVGTGSFLGLWSVTGLSILWAD